MYANSVEEYWSKVDYKIEDMISSLDIWNEHSQNWNRVIAPKIDGVLNDSYISQLFRYPSGSASNYKFVNETDTQSNF